MEKWKVKLTVEKIIEANSRREAKFKLYQEMIRPEIDSFGFGQPQPTFDTVPMKNRTKPLLIDVTASKVADSKIPKKRERGAKR